MNHLKNTVASNSLEHFRSYFPMVAKKKYFMTNSLGAMPNTVGPALQAMMETWVEKGADAWEDWVPRSQKVSDQVGRLIGARAGSVSLHLNVSSLLAQLLSSFDFMNGKRKKIILCDMDFPTLHYLTDTWRAYGAEFEVIQSRDGITVSLEDWKQAIDDKTALVLTCEVFFGSGFKQDIAAIAKLAHAKGAQIAADLYQSVGSMPIDVTAMNVDYALGGSHKYLCGGTGAGWMYVRPDHLMETKPRVTGWLSHADAFAMRPEAMNWTSSMQRFMGGTPSVAPLYVAPCGYDLIEKAGLSEIRKVSLSHTSRVLEWADELKFEVRSPREPSQRGGTLHVRFPGVEKSQVLLNEKGYLVHYRDSYQGLRVAPHFYNTLEEIDGLMHTMKVVADELAR